MKVLFFFENVNSYNVIKQFCIHKYRGSRNILAANIAQSIEKTGTECAYQTTLAS